MAAAVEAIRAAGGVCFITLEDETGVANLVPWPDVFERFRPVAMGARMVLARGRVQTAEGVTHLVADHLEDWTPMLGQLTPDAAPRRAGLRPCAGAGTASARRAGAAGVAGFPLVLRRSGCDGLDLGDNKAPMRLPAPGQRVIITATQH